MVTGNDPIRWLLGRDVLTAHTSDTIRDAARTLTEERVGVLVVLGADGPAGIVSERDLVRGVAEGADPDAERVADVMTDLVLTVEPTEPISAVAATMLANEIRHVVVVEGGRVEGIASIRDIVAVLLRESRPQLAAH